MIGMRDRTNQTSRPRCRIPAWVKAMSALAMLGFLAFALFAPSPAEAAGQQLFCSHKSSNGNTYVETFANTTASQSKIVDAKAILNQVLIQLRGMKNWKDAFGQIAGTASGSTSTFKGVLTGAVLLYVVIFGIMMVLNMLNLTWYEVFMRILRVAIIYYLIFGTGMEDVVARFIMGGMNQLIDAYYDATIGTYNVTLTTNPKDMLTVKPLLFLIAPMEKVMNLQFICAVLSLFFAGPAGMGLAIFLIMGIFAFFMSIVAAIATYIKAIIGLTILFSIAPIFIACLLFDQTRRLFDGWLTMCLSFALQPVFVFAFLGFFMIMIDGALKPLTDMYWCYGPMIDLTFAQLDFYYPVPKEFFESTVTTIRLPTWVVKGGVPVQTGYQDVPLDYHYGTTVKDLWKAAGLDLYVVDVLMFTMLSTLAWRYSDYTGQIAKEIVGGGVSITVTGGQMMEQLKQNGLDPRSLVNRATGGVKDAAGEVSKAFNSKDTVDKMRETSQTFTGNRK